MAASSLVLKRLVSETSDLYRLEALGHSSLYCLDNNLILGGIKLWICVLLQTFLKVSQTCSHRLNSLFQDISESVRMYPTLYEAGGSIQHEAAIMEYLSTPLKNAPMLYCLLLLQNVGYVGDL